MLFFVTLKRTFRRYMFLVYQFISESNTGLILVVRSSFSRFSLQIYGSESASSGEEFSLPKPFIDFIGKVLQPILSGS